MIWIVYILVGLVGLVAAMALIGALLPRDHTAMRSATFARSPDDVWRALTDLDAQPRWRSGVARIETLSPTSFREHGRNGAIAYAIDEDRAPSSGAAARRVTRIADDKLPYGGRWIFELVADGAGSRLTITEEGFIKNPIFRFMSKTVFSTTKTLERFLADLGAHLR
jgi:hypothetical protein